MQKFKIGDCVERIGSIAPTYMRDGIVTRVIPSPDGYDRFTEYEVNFAGQIGSFYESQLRLIKPAKDSN